MSEVSPTVRTASCLAVGLVRRYGRTVALDGVDLEFFPGVNGLLGPNGAGKTTLLGIAATVQARDAGELTLLGHDPADPEGRREIRRRLGFLPQDPGFHPHFTVAEFLDYIAVLKGYVDRRGRRREVDRVASVVELQERAGSRIRTLSGGMRRRLGLAQALIGDPELLVLDEPTAGLDPEQRLRFRSLLSRLGEDRTVVLSTHQTEDVAALCQHVVVLDAGRTLFRGTPQELAALAGGRVWTTPEPAGPGVVSWRTGDGLYRTVGAPVPGAVPAEPGIEDAYLLVLEGARPAGSGS
jgi:ABC-2 type transport system ATP-binding protein